MADGGRHAEALSTDEELAAQFAKSPSRTAWRIWARNQARELFDRVREVEVPPSSDEARETQMRLIRESILRSVEAAEFKHEHLRERLKDWYSGAGVETARAELHRAEERLLMVQSPAAVKCRVSEIDAALRNNLKEDDSRLTPMTQGLERLGRLSLKEINLRAREELRSCLHLANTTDDQARANVRALRNLLIVIGSLVSACLATVILLHALVPDFLAITCPADGKGGGCLDGPVEPWEVVVVGALGGVIAAVFTISKLGGFQGPYRLPVYQALIRIPAGAVVALAAVILLQSGQIKGLERQSGLSLLAVALVFGYAPDVLLRVMDQKATSLLKDAQGKDDPSRPPLSKPRVSP